MPVKRPNGQICGHIGRGRIAWRLRATATAGESVGVLAVTSARSRVYFASSYSPSPLQLHASPEGEQCQVPFPFTPLSFPVPSPKLHVPWAPVGLPAFHVVVS